MPIIQTMLLRSLSQAVYQPDNGGHFGLHFEAYAHFHVADSPLPRPVGASRDPCGDSRPRKRRPREPRDRR